jgi:hypothetical protein
LIGGGLPILFLSLWLPWWRFLVFHSERGFQAESLYSSVIWFMHHLGMVDAVWEGGWRCLEVHGAIANRMLPWSRILFVLTVGVSVLLPCWAVGGFPVSSSDPLPRTRGEGINTSGLGQMPRLAHLLLVPLLAFVVFNQVFSPQFMIWLLPLAAITALNRKLWTTAAIPLATMLTLVFYPSPNYGDGLNLFETGALVVRNFILIIVWVLLVRKLLARTC